MEFKEHRSVCEGFIGPALCNIAFGCSSGWAFEALVQIRNLRGKGDRCSHLYLFSLTFFFFHNVSEFPSSSLPVPFKLI